APPVPGGRGGGGRGGGGGPPGWRVVGGPRCPPQPRLSRGGSLAYNWGIALATLGLAGLANVALALHDAHLDLTRERTFTPSAQAEAVVRSLTQDIQLTYFYHAPPPNPPPANPPAHIPRP